MKRLFVLAAAVIWAMPAVAQIPDTEFAAFHRGLITMDTHTDVDPNLATEALDPGQLTEQQVDLLKLEKGGMDAVFFVAFAAQRQLTPEGLAEARFDSLSRLFAIKRMVEKYPDRIRFARTADDVERIVSKGKLAALIGVENGFPIGDDMRWVKLYFDAGARYMGITHFGNNQLGDSSNPNPEIGDDGPRYNGLSDLGRQAIAEMNKWGIMVDVSHAAMTTTIQAARLSKAPIIASHSGVRAIADVPRNLTDEALIAIRDNGGVAQLVALDSYVKLNPERSDARDAVRKAHGLEDGRELKDLTAEERTTYDGEMAAIDEKFPPATVSDYVDHIDYAVKLVGIDHIGISSDFDGGGGVAGWMNATETPNVTAELLSRGYDAEQIAKLWGGNLRRVMRAVDAKAHELQAAEGD